MKFFHRYILIITLLSITAPLPIFSQVGGIWGKVVYSKSGNVRAHLLGDPAYADLGPGKYARWSPDGRKVAIKHENSIFVANADGSNRIELVNDAEGDDNCPVEFHANGREILFIKDKHIMAVDIETKAVRVLVDYVDCTGELGMDAEQNRVVCRDDHILRAIDLDTGQHTEFADDHCSAGISPDGNYVTYNDNGKPHHLKVHIRKINRDCTDSQTYKSVPHRVMPDEIMGDNHHWSNHNDWITCEGDEHRNGVPYMINVKTQKGYVMVEVKGAKYPDLWVGGSLNPDEGHTQ